MKKQRIFKPTLLIAAIGVSLSLLSVDTSAEEAVFNLDDFETTVSNDGTPTGTGTLEVGVVLDSPFEGVFNYTLSSSGHDGTITAYIDEPLLTLDENMQYSNDGAMHYEFDEETNQFTFTIAEEVYWHDGESLDINLAVISHSDVAEPLANYYLQSCRNIGLNANLLNGRLVEYNAFYDMLGNDTGDIDVYLAAWQVGSDVDQSGYYGGHAPSNFGRYNDETNNEILERGLSEEAFDTEYRIEVYKEWQEYMVEEVPVIPTLYRTLVFPVTENVVNYSIDPYFNEETALYNLGFSE